MTNNPTLKVGRRPLQSISKDNIHTCSRHMKRWPTLVTVREMQVKTPMSCHHLTLVRKPASKRQHQKGYKYNTHILYGSHLNVPLTDENTKKMYSIRYMFPGGSEGKASAYSAGYLGSISGLGRYPGEGNGTPLQYSCLENPTDGGAWEAAVHGVTKSQTWLSDFTLNLYTYTWNTTQSSKKKWHNSICSNVDGPRDGPLKSDTER